MTKMFRERECRLQAQSDRFWLHSSGFLSALPSVGQLLASEFKGLLQFSASHPHTSPLSTRELLFSKSSKVLSFIVTGPINSSEEEGIS